MIIAAASNLTRSLKESGVCLECVKGRDGSHDVRPQVWDATAADRLPEARALILEQIALSANAPAQKESVIPDDV